MDVDRILDLLSQDRINREVLQQHDVARESFQAPSVTVRDHQEFKFLVTSYVEHHKRVTDGGTPGPAAAFGEGKRILDKAFGQDQFQEGYAAAMQAALSGANGGLRQVLNEIADALKHHALNEYMDHVYHQHINVLSKEDNRELSRAFFQRFGPILQRFGVQVDQDTFAWNTRAALEYHRQVIAQITGIARKL